MRPFVAAIHVEPLLTSLLQDIELEGEDDGSSTVTNSITIITDLAPPVLVLAEDLAAKLESVTTAVLDDPVQEISHDRPTAELLPTDEPATDLDDLILEEISVEILPPSGPFSDVADITPDPVRLGAKVTTNTNLETILEEETSAEDDFLSQDDLESVEPWLPDDDIPIIVVTPPEVDSEDFASQSCSEGEQKESEDVFTSYRQDGDEESDYDDDCELECAGYRPRDSPVEVAPISPPSPVRDDPCRSPITTSGLLWSDDEGNDLGPLPTFQDEPQSPPVNEKTSEVVPVISESSSGMYCYPFLLEK